MAQTSLRSQMLVQQLAAACWKPRLSRNRTETLTGTAEKTAILQQAPVDFATMSRTVRNGECSNCFFALGVYIRRYIFLCLVVTPNQLPAAQASCFCCRLYEETAPKRQLTIRAVTTGLCVGSILCFSNTYFGLQTGWVTMGSLQSAILGFGVFRVLNCFDCMKGFTVEENVIVQTTSVATATMPLAAGELNFTMLQ